MCFPNVPHGIRLAKRRFSKIKSVPFALAAIPLLHGIGDLRSAGRGIGCEVACCYFCRKKPVVRQPCFVDLSDAFYSLVFFGDDQVRVQTKSNKMTVAVQMNYLMQEKDGDETHE